MGKNRWRERLERTGMVIERLALTGVKATVISSLISSLGHAEHDGLHDHPETRSIMVGFTAPVIVTGTSLPDQS
jgi:hypothetical protein